MEKARNNGGQKQPLGDMLANNTVMHTRWLINTRLKDQVSGLGIIFALPKPKGGGNLIALLEKAADEVGLDHRKEICTYTEYTPNGLKTVEEEYNLEIYDKKVLGRLRGKLKIKAGAKSVYSYTIRLLGYGAYASDKKNEKTAALASAFYRLAEKEAVDS
jgi:hypothetical protein